MISELDSQLNGLLQQLGLDEQTFRAVTLLPLVEVAWADGRIQANERNFIAEVALGNGLVEGPSYDKVMEWLQQRPSAEYFTLGRKLLVKLAFRRKGLGGDVPEHALDNVVDMCVVVAESAGGLFGMLWKVSSSERHAIQRITDHLTKLADGENPQRGIVGRTITMDWKKMMEEMNLQE